MGILPSERCFDFADSAWGLWANVLNPLFMQWAFWERCSGDSDRSFLGLTYSGTQREHSSVLASARYAYLNWWQAISGCRATAFHIILSPTLSPCLTPRWLFLAFPHSQFLLCLSHSLFCSPPTPSYSRPLSLALTKPISPHVLQCESLAVVYLVCIPPCFMEILWCLEPTVMWASSLEGSV